MRRVDEYCPICDEVMDKNESLVVVQMIRFKKFALDIEVFAICYYCGMVLHERIMSLKKQIV